MTRKRYGIDVDTLNQLISYDPASGILTWKERPLCFFSKEADMNAWNARWAHKPAGRLLRNGYIGIGIFYRATSAHILAWAILSGDWPPEGYEVDHINHNPSDNRAENLRLATKSQNIRNRRKITSKTSVYKGVSWVKESGRWGAWIRAGGGSISLGQYPTQELAYEAYVRAAKELHGEFFCPG